MEIILNWIEGLSSFQQSILGSAVFAFSSWLIQKIAKKAKSSGSAAMKAYAELDVHKHVLHKEYVRSGNIQLASYGASIAMLLAARWVMLGILIFLFFFGIDSLIQGQWLYVVAAWFTFNCMLEARNWLKDSSNDETIAHIPDETISRIYENLRPKSREEVEQREES